MNTVDKKRASCFALVPLIFALLTALSVFGCASSAPTPEAAPEPVSALEPDPAPDLAAGEETPVEPLPAPRWEYFHGLILEGAKPYTVVKGDTLSDIAKKKWDAGQNPYFFPVLALTAENIISDPDVIKPGTKLAIPDLKVNLEDPEARAKIKICLKEAAAFYARSDKFYKNDMVQHLSELAEGL